MKRFKSDELDEEEGKERLIGEPEPYYAGLVASDGHLEPDSYTITVASSDKDFMDNIVSQIVEKQGCKGSLFWDAGADIYKLKITDKRLWERLTGKYNIPTGKKSRDIEPPKDISLREKRWYIRGWLDGDG